LPNKNTRDSDNEQEYLYTCEFRDNKCLDVEDQWTS